MENLSQQKKSFLSSWARLSANWQLAEDRVKPLSQEYFEVFKQVGEGRFNRAVTAIIHSAELAYFPSVAAFRGYVPSSAEVRQYCGKCEHGWIFVPDEKARELYHNQAEMAMPCECTGGVGRLQRLHAKQ